MSLLVLIIYIAFVSLGLPDSLLGSGWPEMHIELGASLSSAGILAFIISASTVTSALFSDKFAVKFGTGRVTAFSVMLTAASMMMFSFAGSFGMLCMLAVPYGLGAGAIDACLNNYVALHLSSKHMSWLHCCWGIGATLSPYIMSACLMSRWGWRGGYRTVSIIQIVLTFLMFAALPLWKKQTEKAKEAGDEEAVVLIKRQIFALPGAKQMFVSFLIYCAIENIPMVWASSYYAGIYNLSAEKAAAFGSLFYIGMTAGRAVCGFFADKMGDKNMIRYGALTAIAGAVIVALPLGTYIPSVAGFIIIGLGCAPIYPAFIHSTPANFGKKYSQSIIGVQMAFAYIGMTVTPYIFGKSAELTTISILPFCVIGLCIIMLILTENLNTKIKNKTVV